MNTSSCFQLSIVHLEGLVQDEGIIDSKREKHTSYIATKKHPFTITIAAHGVYLNLFHVTVSLYYYDLKNNQPTQEPVKFVNTFPVCNLITTTLSICLLVHGVNLNSLSLSTRHGPTLMGVHCKWRPPSTLFRLSITVQCSAL